MDGGDAAGLNDAFPNYQAELEKCTEFLREFQVFGAVEHKYQEKLQAVANRELTVVEIELDDVMAVRLLNHSSVVHTHRL